MHEEVLGAVGALGGRVDARGVRSGLRNGDPESPLVHLVAAVGVGVVRFPAGGFVIFGGRHPEGTERTVLVAEHAVAERPRRVLAGEVVGQAHGDDGWVPLVVSVGGRHEAHHAGFTDDRRHLWASGLDTSKIFIFDVASDPSAPKLVKTIEDFAAAKAQEKTQSEAQTNAQTDAQATADGKTKSGDAEWQVELAKGIDEIQMPFDPGTAYIATTRYKFNDHSPGLYKTTNYGASWTKIDKGIPEGAFTRVVREDDVRRDLLYAGTERGVYLSWNGGKDWTPFQLNLPVTPITDLRVHQGNLIAATSGRSFWILDDLSLIRQHTKDRPALMLYKPGNAYLVNGSSELDQNDAEDKAEFKGAATFNGVNPATGIVVYYQLPELQKTDDITLEVSDADGHVIRTFSSKAVPDQKKWDGGPKPDPLLPKAKGLNRFVWDMRYPTMTGVPEVYFEASYAGHKAMPGKYRFTLKSGDQTLSSEAEILANPLYTTDAAGYQAYHALMSRMEAALSAMHQRVNELHDKQTQLEALLAKLPGDEKSNALKAEGEALLAKLKAWDEDMVQRRSKAYDDVENFPNKFTASYLFLINQTESNLPQINASTLEELQLLDAKWATLEARSDELLEKDIPAMNSTLWKAGYGALWR